MAFRMTGNTKEPPAKPVFFQIHGKFRGLSSSEGVPFNIPPPRTTGKLSQSTLYKIFTIMLGSVFIIYCSLMMVMVQYQRESSILESEGRWGPTLAVSHQVLQDHIQRQVEQKRLQLEEELKERRLRDSAADVRSPDHKESPLVVPTTDKKDADSVVDLEKMDTHEKQPLEAKAETSDIIQQDGSNENHETKNATNTTKSP